MQAFKVIITRFIDDHQPGFVECQFRDAFEKVFTIVEKVPVVSDLSLNQHSSYPLEGFVACEVMDRWTDEAGRFLVRVGTSKPWAIETVEGLQEFVLAEKNLVTIK